MLGCELQGTTNLQRTKNCFLRSMLSSLGDFTNGRATSGSRLRRPPSTDPGECGEWLGYTSKLLPTPPGLASAMMRTLPATAVAAVPFLSSGSSEVFLLMLTCSRELPTPTSWSKLLAMAGYSSWLLSRRSAGLSPGRPR